MPSRKLNVLLLFDVPFTPDNDLDASEYMVGDEWKDERDVMRALTRLGHKVSAFGVFDDIRPLVDKVRAVKPDVIFNLCESFNADRKQEPNLPALLELLGVPYTGANPEALTLCKDKGLSKKLLTYHKVRVPEFAVAPRRAPLPKGLSKFVYPGICKPLGLDASEGIAKSSLVTNAEDCAERVRFIHERLGTDAIVEEYIEGRELYVGVFGNERLTILPPQELFFKKLPSDAPRVLTFRAKWDDEYRKKYGIDSDAAKPIEAKTLQKLNETCKEIYRLFKITGYARIDLRLSDQGECVFLEINPNPSIKKSDDFAFAAKRAGISYDELLNKLVHLPLAG
jgi:D-alanine-D-alanine ligase